MFTDQPTIDLQDLYADAIAEVDSGVETPCHLSEQCVIGCPRCYAGMLRGDLGIESLTLYKKTGVLRVKFTTSHDGKQPCEVVLAGVAVEIR
jgi:hypothetical protein